MFSTKRTVSLLAITLIVFAAVVINSARREKQSPDALAVAPQAVSAQSAPSVEPKRAPDVPYVPTPHEVVAEMLRLAKVSKDDVVYDLGCGDGRIVIAAAQKHGARGVGIDINPQRIVEAEENAKTAGVTDRVKFLEQDLFQTDLSEATVIALYLLPDINLKLRPKLLQLKPGTRIVSHSFDMGDWKPEYIAEVNGRVIYYWTVPADAARTQQ